MARRPSIDEKIDAQIIEGGGGAYVRVRTPKREKGEMFAIAEQLLGASKIRVVCADGKTRLAVNSHQPWTGPVAWYEARQDGRVGPGSTVMLIAFGAGLTWAGAVVKM